MTNGSIDAQAALNMLSGILARQRLGGVDLRWDLQRRDQSTLWRVTSNVCSALREIRRFIIIYICTLNPSTTRI